MKIFYTTLFALSIGSAVFAQQAINNDSLNVEMQKISEPRSTLGFIRFKDDARIDPATIFTEFKSAFGLAENDKMVIYKSETDELGFTHLRYQQYYKSLKIEGAEYIVHTNKSGVTYAANGNLLTGIDINITPAISAAKAIGLTLNHVNAASYKWQSDSWEKELQARSGKPDTSYYPSPELVIRQVKNKDAAGIAVKHIYLAYKIDIYSSSPNYAQRIFVDAHSGKIIESLPLQSD